MFVRSAMTNDQAWGVKGQTICSMGDGVTSSPCLSCKHAKEDKNICRAYPACPIRIPTVLPSNHALYREITEPIPKKECPCEGCNNQIRVTALVCQKCWPRINHRLRNGVPEAMLYTSGKLPNNWRELYGTQDYGRKKGRQ
jgi:hypothetical protein